MAKLIQPKSMLLDTDATYTDPNVQPTNRTVTRNLQTLIDSLAQDGQQQACIVEEMPDGRYRRLVGHGRFDAIKILKERGVEDPLTCKREIVPSPDGEGTVERIVPGTGKTFGMVKCLVYPPASLTELDALKIAYDHGTIETLTRIGIYEEAENLFRVHADSKTVLTLIGNGWEIISPTPEKIKAMPEATPEEKAAKTDALYKHRRGILQTFERAAKGPVVMRDAYVEVLRKNRRNPTTAEMTKLYALYTKEIAEDRDFRKPGSGKNYNRENPGPRFLAEWAKVEEAHQEALAKGGDVRPKSTAMMNNDQVDGLKKSVSSLTLQYMCGVIRNEVNKEGVVRVDMLMCEIEKEHPSLLETVRAALRYGKAPEAVDVKPEATEVEPEAA